MSAPYPAATSSRLPWRGPHTAIVALLAATLVLSLVFLAFPSIDLWATSLFYRPGSGFPAGDLALLEALRNLATAQLWAIVLALLAALAIKLARPREPAPIPPRAILFLLTTLAVAPGLIVNLWLKNAWGRPRPFAVEAFGGSAPYVPVWEISDYCVRNCSFVSGEASSAIWLVAVALVLPVGWRRSLLWPILAWATLLSMSRVAFGHHFLSDVLLAWTITLLLIAVAYRAIVVAPPEWLSPGTLERGLTGAGLALRRALGHGESPGQLRNPAAEDRNGADRLLAAGREDQEGDHGEKAGQEGDGHGGLR